MSTTAPEARDSSGQGETQITQTPYQRIQALFDTLPADPPGNNSRQKTFINGGIYIADTSSRISHTKELTVLMYSSETIDPDADHDWDHMSRYGNLIISDEGVMMITLPEKKPQTKINGVEDGDFPNLFPSQISSLNEGQSIRLDPRRASERALGETFVRWVKESFTENEVAPFPTILLEVSFAPPPILARS